MDIRKTAALLFNKSILFIYSPQKIGGEVTSKTVPPTPASHVYLIRVTFLTIFLPDVEIFTKYMPEGNSIPESFLPFHLRA